MPEKDFLKYVEAVCRRPNMYTPGGTFNETISLLEGFGMGANVGAGGAHSSFTPFLQWIVQKFEIPEIIIDWRHFREMFSSESEALKNLPILYKEYVEYVEAGAAHEDSSSSGIF